MALGPGNRHLCPHDQQKCGRHHQTGQAILRLCPSLLFKFQHVKVDFEQDASVFSPWGS